MAQDHIAWLIQQDVSTVREWLRRSWSGVQAVPEDFPWNQVAAALEVLAKSGQGPDTGKPDLAWANVTVSVYDYLLHQADPVSRMMLQDRLMELKGYCMVHLGPVADDPILDVGQLVTWFFQHRSFSLQEAKEMCEFPQRVDIHALGILRKMKNRMYFLHLLVNDHKFTPDEELREWLFLREKMP